VRRDWLFFGRVSAREAQRLGVHQARALLAQSSVGQRDRCSHRDRDPFDSPTMSRSSSHEIPGFVGLSPEVECHFVMQLLEGLFALSIQIGDPSLQ